MTPSDVLADLLARVGASKGKPVFISAQELGGWPATTVATMKAQKILVRARPAASVVCPGCEQQCVMPVHVPPAPSEAARAFVVCDKRDDINRVNVPIGHLEQWRVNGYASPAAVAEALGVPLSPEMTSARQSRQSRRDTEIRSKFAELAQAGKRNYVKDIQRTVPGAETLSDRRIRDIVKDR